MMRAAGAAAPIEVPLVERLEARLLLSVDYLFPSDGGLVNVKDWGAKGDGVTDDTAAIQAALMAYPNGRKIIYIPNGTYIISDTLVWPHKVNTDGTIDGGTREKRTCLQGESTDGAILKLADNCAGYQDPNNRKAMIWTGGAPAQRFGNGIRSLTVNTGSGNPGACGIQYISNNIGTMSEVTIRSGDGQGVIGLDFAFSNEIGPLLARDVRVIGFDYGIKIANSVDSETLENITLEGQRLYGLYNTGQCVSIHNLTSTNTCQAVYNSGEGFINLINATLNGSGGASGVSAIRNSGYLFARDVTTSGYLQAIDNTSGTGADVLGASVTEFVSHSILSNFTSPQQSLRLTILPTPTVPWDPLSQWDSPLAHGGLPNDGVDDTAAFQAAIDSGKTTVYLPNGAWNLNGTVYIRGNVRRIIGLEAWHNGTCTIRIENGTYSTVVWERFSANYSTLDFVQASSRTLVISACNTSQVSSTGTGDIFIDDVCGGPFYFTNQRVFARQINPEMTTTKITNDHSDLWILGLKTERGGTLIETKNGGRTELMGGFSYSTSSAKTMPMFINDNSTVSLSIGESNYNGNPWLTLVQETRGEITDTLDRGEAPYRGNGSALTLYVGYKPTDATGPTTPANLHTTSVTSTQIDLAWNAASDAESGVLYYRVYRDGVQIGVSRTTSYSDTTTSGGLTYSYRVSAVNNAVVASSQSGPLSVTTTGDVTPPGITSATAADGTHVSVLFNEPVDSTTAQTSANYSISGGISVTAAVLQADGQTVLLTTSTLAARGSYTLTVNNIRDRAVPYNVIAANTTVNFATGELGDGLRGDYYDVNDLTTLKLSRVDAGVNFDWTSGSPDPSIGGDTFSVRWTGWVVPEYSQTYTFYTTTDDGVRLWVNGTQLINKWVNQSATEWSGTIALTAGQCYYIRMEYYDNSGNASAKLSWSSSSRAKEIIPSTRLYSSDPRGAYSQDSGSNHLVSIEAEHYNSTAGQASQWWVWTTDTGYSGDGVMQALPNSGTTTNTGYVTGSPSLNYKVKFDTTGTYYVWILGRAATTSDDSLHAGLDGATISTCDRIGGGFTTTWAWSKTTQDSSSPATFSVSTPGVHTLNIYMREDGFILDKIVLTTSSSYTPTGTGPVESARLGPNVAPTVGAGLDAMVYVPASSTTLAGTVSDDGQNAPCTTSWSKVSGPGTVTFGNASLLSTTATFSAQGVYVLRLTANDGEQQNSDDVTITVAPHAGDVTWDGLVTAADIDAMSAALAAGSADLRYDTDHSGAVTTDDKKHLVETIIGTRDGDTNLDRAVAIGDLVALAQHWNGPGNWADGDSSGDGQITIGDLVALAQNWAWTAAAGGSAAAAAVEPQVDTAVLAAAVEVADAQSAPRLPLPELAAVDPLVQTAQPQSCLQPPAADAATLLPAGDDAPALAACPAARAPAMAIARMRATRAGEAASPPALPRAWREAAAMDADDVLAGLRPLASLSHRA
jgi:fibronectin type 3 domain-containing protein